MRRRLALVIVMVVISGCATAPAPDTSAPVADRPVWTVGDTWRYRAISGAYTYEMRFVGAGTFEKKPAFTVTAGSYTLYFSENYGLMARERNGKVVRRITPPLDWQWPLRVGRSWYWFGTWEDTERTFRQYTYRDVWTVQALEDVTVPAGTFKAYRVVRRVTDGDAWDETWYSPAVKRPVKQRGSSVVGAFDEELVAYTVQ